MAPITRTRRLNTRPTTQPGRFLAPSHWPLAVLCILLNISVVANDQEAAGNAPSIVLEDFESTVPVMIDPIGVLTGYVVFDDGHSSVSFSTTTQHPPVPGEPTGNSVLRLDVQVRDWAVFAHFFGEIESGGSRWIAHDWQAYHGISFWLMGHNSDVELFVDIIENRNPGSNTDDAERFVYTFKDNFVGWKRICVPFSAFKRKDIGNGAPDDGLKRDRVHGWALGATATAGPVTYYMDDFSLEPGPAGTGDPAAFPSAR